jgi:enamine deaminase RidA (YjgF/YER057c/UK114 family)
MSTQVQCLDPPALGPPHPSGIFSNITSISIGNSNFITISGQVATTPEGHIPSTLSEQIELVLSKLTICLQAVNGTVRDLTRLAYFMVEHDPEITTRVLAEKVRPWLEGHRPASSYLVVRGLSQKEFLCEFEAMAVVSREEEREQV